MTENSMLKKLTPSEFKKFIIQATGRPGQDYIPRDVLKALQAKRLASHLTSHSASPNQIREAIETLREKGFLSSYRGYTKENPEKIFTAYQKKYGSKEETKKTILENKKTLAQERIEKKKELEAKKAWGERIEARKKYIQRERIWEEEKREMNREKEEEGKEPGIPDAKEAVDLPLAA